MNVGYSSTYGMICDDCSTDSGCLSGCLRCTLLCHSVVSTVTLLHGSNQLINNESTPPNPATKQPTEATNQSTSSALWLKQLSRLRCYSNGRPASSTCTATCARDMAVLSSTEKLHDGCHVTTVAAPSKHARQPSQAGWTIFYCRRKHQVIRPRSPTVTLN